MAVCLVKIEGCASRPELSYQDLIRAWGWRWDLVELERGSRGDRDDGRVSGHDG